MFDSVIRSVVAEEYHTVFIIVQTDLGHLFALKHGSGSTSPDVVTSLEIYVYHMDTFHSYDRAEIEFPIKQISPTEIQAIFHRNSRRIHDSL